jgi:ABC-2 type transport system permease protein
MNLLAAALQSECLKVLRSKVLLFTFLGFSLVPLAGGYFMWILKDPEAARQMGLIGAKAQITAGTAEWPSLLTMLAQVAAAGGMVVDAIMAGWLFGREFSDRTMKDLLALPVPRSTFVAAKFIVLAAWSYALSAYMYLLGLAAGHLVVIPGWSAGLAWEGALTVAECTGLALAVTTPVAFFACYGRGYLPPIGWMFFTMVLAQIAAATGWGPYFPWSVPALHSGAAGSEAALLPAFSYWLVALASAGGLAATFAWMQFADQPI